MGHNILTVVQQSSHAIWIHVFTNKELVVFEINKDVLNCASDRLAISSLLSYIVSGALICSFICAIFFFFCPGVPVV